MKLIDRHLRTIHPVRMFIAFIMTGKERLSSIYALFMHLSYESGRSLQRCIRLLNNNEKDLENRDAMVSDLRLN